MPQIDHKVEEQIRNKVKNDALHVSPKEDEHKNKPGEYKAEQDGETEQLKVTINIEMNIGGGDEKRSGESKNEGANAEGEEGEEDEEKEKEEKKDVVEKEEEEVVEEEAEVEGEGGGFMSSLVEILSEL